MRRYVNGEEIAVAESATTVTPAGDRLVVRTPNGTRSALAVRVGDAVLVSYRGRQYRVERKAPRRRANASAASGELRAPMPGQIVDVRVSEGDVVEEATTLLVLEAMKTQQPFVAPYNGRVSRLLVKTGDQVADGALLALVEPLTDAKGDE